MEHGVETVSGWILGATEYAWFLGVWLVIAIGYALWRSRGEAKQDPIRPSGPSA